MKEIFHAIRTGELILPNTDSEYFPEVKNTADFWSINCYTRELIDSRKANPMNGRYEHKRLQMVDIEFYLEEMYPEIMMANLSRLTDKPVIITENGCSGNE